MRLLTFAIRAETCYSGHMLTFTATEIAARAQYAGRCPADDLTDSLKLRVCGDLLLYLGKTLNGPEFDTVEGDMIQYLWGLAESFEAAEYVRNIP